MIGVNSISMGLNYSYFYNVAQASKNNDKITDITQKNTQKQVQNFLFNTLPKNEPQFPIIRQGVDPTEMAVRNRIKYINDDKNHNIEKDNKNYQHNNNKSNLNNNQQNEPKLSINKKDDSENKQPIKKDDEKNKSPYEIMQENECQTCNNRTYQDGSDDMSVSYKNPTKIAPEQAASAVRSHEQEHVTNEQADAKREGREIISQSVTIHTSICPECGDVYVSGGTTRTTSRTNVSDIFKVNKEQPNLFQGVA